LIGAALFGTLANAHGYSIREFGAEQLRLKTIGYRLSAMNAGTCADPHMLSGLVLHDLTEYEPALRSAISNAFSLHNGIGVLGVVPEGVAAQAGLQVDDEIVALNGRSVEDAISVYRGAQSYRRMDVFTKVLANTLTSGSADLLVRRHDQLVHIRLRGQPGCGGETLLINSSDLNAWSDGTHIFVSSAMMRVAPSDDQLAFVVAHEMAHNILGHSSGGDTHGLLGLFGFGASKVRRQEVMADTVAVPIMSAGGYSPAAAAQLLETMRKILWWDISLDHPGFGERIRTVASAIARLNLQPNLTPADRSADANPALKS
jgi:PDZ domain/Peptidase family M48